MSPSGTRLAVVGLGALGSMTAWRAAERGLQVTGFEQYGVAHDRGASAGQTRRLSVQTQSEHRLTPVALQAVDLWRELEGHAGRELLRQTGGLIFGPSGTPALESAIRSAVDHVLDHEVLDAASLRARFPAHVVRDGDAGVTDPMAGYLRPEAAVAHAVARASRLGATVHDHTRVLDLETREDGVRITSSQGVETFDRVVVTTGPWARELVAGAHERVLPRRLVQGWYLARDPAAYAPDVFGVFERVGDVNAYGFPSLDGATVKIGVYTTPHPVVNDLGTVRRSVSTALARRLAGIVEQLLPGVRPDPVTLATGVEGYTTDGLPLLGPVGESLLVGVGCSGSGFKFAPAYGDALAALAAGERPAHDLGFLDPGRDLAPWDAALTGLE